MKKTSKNTIETTQKTKSITYRIDVNVSGEGTLSTYMIVTGVPEDLPEEYENTVQREAEARFCAALNERKFLEFYNLGKTSKEEHPKFYNLEHITWIQVVSIKKIN